MKQRIKQYILIAIGLGAVYFLLSYHLVFYGMDVTLLKKSELHFNQTFVSIKPTEFSGPEDVLKNDVLRRDGIGDILVEKGLLTEDERWKLEDQYDAEDDTEEEKES
jgi:hypothetical protein